MAKKIKGEDGKIYVEKKPFYKRVWFIALVVIVIIVALMPKGDKDGNSTVNEAAETSTKEITYTPVDAGQMLDDLENNALNAEKTYKDQDLEITGKIYAIDSSGKYIAIDGLNSEFTISGVTCYLKNDEQKDVVASVSKGATVVVRGHVTDVGEVMGYSVNIDEIEAK
ncbi:OB-fold protein [Peptoniphilus catoniae]|uniref:OB-fold protein n=1 Tax=Peptoniphilus catoniae TaxID=1660341 RepID=UPI0010FF2A51|nr:hypothetical protein [Peptoniphilus catoniae]